MAGKKKPKESAMPVKVQYVLTSEHVQALRDEAHRRWAPGGSKPDASAVLREVLDAWMKKSQRR